MLVTFLKFDVIYILEYFVEVIMNLQASKERPFGDIYEWVNPILWTLIPMTFILFFVTAYCVRHEHTLRTFILMVSFIPHLKI